MTGTDELSEEDLDDVSGGKLMGEMLSNVSKMRSEIALTIARNSRD